MVRNIVLQPKAKLGENSVVVKKESLECIQLFFVFQATSLINKATFFLLSSSFLSLSSSIPS